MRRGRYDVCRASFCPAVGRVGNIRSRRGRLLRARTARATERKAMAARSMPFPMRIKEPLMHSALRLRASALSPRRSAILSTKRDGAFCRYASGLFPKSTVHPRKFRALHFISGSLKESEGCVRRYEPGQGREILRWPGFVFLDVVCLRGAPHSAPTISFASLTALTPSLA